MPGKRDDFGDGAVQRFGDAVAQFETGQQFDQFGVFVDGDFVFAGDVQNGLGQLVVALGAQGRGALAVG